MATKDSLRIVLARMVIEGEPDTPNLWIDGWIPDDDALTKYRDRSDSEKIEELGVFDVDLRILYILELETVLDAAISLDENIAHPEHTFAKLLTAFFRFGFEAGRKQSKEN